MENPDLLTQYITRLNPQGIAPVQVRRLLKDLGIELEKRVIDGSRRDRNAFVQRSGSKAGYKIVLLREDATPSPLTSRERFVLAHELAHVLLEMSQRPRPTSKGDYWQIERLCDDFAGRLLIPESIVLETEIKDPSSALAGLRMISDKCKVSIRTAAHRLAASRPSLAFLEARPKQKDADDFVMRITWIKNSDGYLDIPTGKELNGRDVLGSLLLETWRSDLQVGQSKQLEASGLGKCVIRRKPISLLASFMEH
jgi:hypothetical protein